MPLIRAEALATVGRWREVGLGVAGVALGLWVATRGGPILAVLGLVLATLGAGFTLAAYRRLRFAQTVDAPGLVELIEGEVRYFGPTFGGTISLNDLTEIRLLTLRGRRMWRLKQFDGQTLLVPIDASGADGLYDGFASLPGLDMAALLVALSPGPSGPGLVAAEIPETALIWHRKGRGLVA